MNIKQIINKQDTKKNMNVSEDAAINNIEDKSQRRIQ